MNTIGHHKEEVGEHVHIEHMNAYGFCEGDTTLAVSGMINLPAVSSIARRGKWSMRKAMDIYWYFSEPGEHYLA